MRTSSDPVIRTLDDDRLRRHIGEILSVDHAVRAELGDAYSHEAWTARDFERDRPGRGKVSRAIFESGRIVGFAIAAIDDGALHLHRLAVDPAHRRRGLGRRLVDALERAARDHRLDRITLSVAASNTAARAFWSTIGFHPLTGPTLHDFAVRHDFVITDGTAVSDGHPYHVLSKRLR